MPSGQDWYCGKQNIYRLSNDQLSSIFHKPSSTSDSITHIYLSTFQLMLANDAPDQGWVHISRSTTDMETVDIKSSSTKLVILFPGFLHDCISLALLSLSCVE